MDTIGKIITYAIWASLFIVGWVRGFQGEDIQFSIYTVGAAIVAAQMLLSGDKK